MTAADDHSEPEKGNTPGACPEGIGDTGELTSTIVVEGVGINPSVERALSASRLSTYRQAAVHDAHAWRLYEWNLSLVAAFSPLAADLEVALRNGIHEQLGRLFNRQDWWASDRVLLDDDTAQMIAAAVQRHKKQLAKGTVGPGKVVAELTLGTWVNLLGRGGHSALGRAIDYETRLWRPALRLAFEVPTPDDARRVRRPTRDDVHKRAALFQRVRNRAAHHEPIFNGVAAPGDSRRVDLITVWTQCIELLSWLSPELALRHQSTLSDVFDRRPLE